MTYETNKFLAISMQAFQVERYVVTRRILAAGLAYHFAKQGETDESGATLKLYREALKAAGAVKSEVSSKASDAKKVGDNIAARFAPELATLYADETDMLEACMAAAVASGATSRQKFMDFMVHGDAELSAKNAAAKEADREAKATAKAADALAALASVEVQPLAMGAPVTPKPVEVQNFEPKAEAEAEAETVEQAVAALIERFGFDAVKDAMMADAATPTLAKVS